MPKVSRPRGKRKPATTTTTATRRQAELSDEEVESGPEATEEDDEGVELKENAEGLLELRPKKKKSKAEAKKHKKSQQIRKKNQKAFFEEMFHEIVQFAHRVFGRNDHEGTEGSELAKFCSEQFGDKFKGVFAANQVPHDIKELKEGYYIVNTDPFHMPGTHWTAIADGLFYDSYDRKSTKLFPYIDLPSTGKNRVTEQKANESNCGERCVAFLVIYHNFGPGPAAKYL
jgi:hypothetical protein